MSEASVDIKLPKTAMDLRIRHLKAFTNSDNLSGDITQSMMAQFISDLTDVPLYKLRFVSSKDLRAAFAHCLNVFEQASKVKLTKTIKVNGKVYELVDAHKVAYGWHIDVRRKDKDLAKDHGRAAALMYIEKNVSYGMEDDNGNVIYPLSERKALFEEHLPLPYLLSGLAFFLSKYEPYTKAFTALNLARKLPTPERKRKLPFPINLFKRRK